MTGLGLLMLVNPNARSLCLLLIITFTAYVFSSSDPHFLPKCPDGGSAIHHLLQRSKQRRARDTGEAPHLPGGAPVRVLRAAQVQEEGGGREGGIEELH